MALSTDKFTILKASGDFTKAQKLKKITPDDIEEASRFGSLLWSQMIRDQRTGFKFWDSCSMLEQTDCLFETNAERAEFVKWVFEKLDEVKS